MKFGFADLVSSRRDRVWTGVLVAGVAFVVISSIVIGVALATAGRVDDHSTELRRDILENAFYLTKVRVQLDAIADYRPGGAPEDVRREVNRLRFPLSSHMGMYFRPELQEAILEKASAPAPDLRKLRRSASGMWDVYIDLRTTLERVARSTDLDEQSSLLRDARETIGRWLPIARQYNDALFVVQAIALSRLEHRIAVFSRVATGVGALAVAATTLLVVLLVRWVVHERRHRRELEGARKEAERASRAKSVFLATLSHELRTPLHGMSGLMDLLDREGLSEAQREHLGLLRSTAGGLLHQVESLLDLSAVEAGKVRPRLSPTRVRESLAGVIESARNAAVTKGLRFSVAWPNDDRLRLLDCVRVGQVVTNLASNAIEYTREGFVDVSLALVDETLTIVVRDSGVGIREEDRERVFEMFVQAEEGYTRSHGGTGAGLAIVRRLVDALGGTLELDSQVGEGSAFTVTLPATLGTPTASEEGTSDVPVLAGPDDPGDWTEGVRVLVAEDEAINRLYLRMVLERNGFVVTEAGNGTAALEWLETGEFDLGLLDISMPGMSGLDVVRAFRRIENRADERLRTPLVALTAHARAEDRTACLDAGFDDYLTKPFDEQTLIARIGTVLVGAPAG